MYNIQHKSTPKHKTQTMRAFTTLKGLKGYAKFQFKLSARFGSTFCPQSRKLFTAFSYSSHTQSSWKECQIPQIRSRSLMKWHLRNLKTTRRCCNKKVSHRYQPFVYVRFVLAPEGFQLFCFTARGCLKTRWQVVLICKSSLNV